MLDPLICIFGCIIFFCGIRKTVAFVFLNLKIIYSDLAIETHDLVPYLKRERVGEGGRGKGREIDGDM